MAHDDEHYRVLGVPRNASTPEIRRAYRRLARQHHPDRNSEPDGPERFHRLVEAYAALTDQGRRTREDYAIRQPARRHVPRASPAMRTGHGVLELSAREVQLAATIRLRLTTRNGLTIVLPAGVADGDQIMFTVPEGRVVLTVRVDFAPKT